MPAEKDLYPSIEKFLKKNFACAEAQSEVGTQYGRIDVLGLREHESHFASNAELVAVEAKIGSTPSFLKSCGQTFAYSLYAHRAYLAWDRAYTKEEIDMAAKFGIGLLSISNSKKISLIRSSTEFKPEHRHVLQLLYKLDRFECTICRACYTMDDNLVVKINPDGNISSEYRGEFQEAVASRHHAVYWLSELAKVRHGGKEQERVSDRRYICKDCCSIFTSLLPE